MIVPEKTETIEWVGLADGQQVPLSEYPCDNCGAEGCAHIFLNKGGTFAFCSWDHLVDSMRIAGEPITEENLAASGSHVIGPRPDA